MKTSIILAAIAAILLDKLGVDKDLRRRKQCLCALYRCGKRCDGVICGKKLTLSYKNDIGLLRTTKFGDEIWAKTFGGGENEHGNYVRNTNGVKDSG